MLDDVLEKVRDEVLRAQDLHPPINSLHEGYAVILEELDELWQHVKNRVRSPELMRAMRKEAIQVGAMALRFLVDVCGEVS